MVSAPPVFGIQWNPPEPEIAKARRVITFLEDRRALYTPGSIENPEHCVRSILDIRNFLTDEISLLDSNHELAKNLCAMRASCRKFLNEIENSDCHVFVKFARSPGHWSSWKFYGDLGILRGVFGLHIAMIAVAYGLDVESELKAILPDLDEHDKHGFTKLGLEKAQ